MCEGGGGAIPNTCTCINKLSNENEQNLTLVIITILIQRLGGRGVSSFKIHFFSVYKLNKEKTLVSK